MPKALRACNLLLIPRDRACHALPCPLCPSKGNHRLALKIPRSEKRLEHLGEKQGREKGRNLGEREVGRREEGGETECDLPTTCLEA